MIATYFYFYSGTRQDRIQQSGNGIEGTNHGAASRAVQTCACIFTKHASKILIWSLVAE